MIWFLLTFSAAPMRFFGGIGLGALLISAAAYLFLLVLWIVAQTQIRPLFGPRVGSPSPASCSS